MNLAAYLKRIGVNARQSLRTDVASLALIMDAHSREIAFENCDVVLNKRISIEREDVERKLVCDGRGGYCVLL